MSELVSKDPMELACVFLIVSNRVDERQHCKHRAKDPAAANEIGADGADNFATGLTLFNPGCQCRHAQGEERRGGRKEAEKHFR